MSMGEHVPAKWPCAKKDCDAYMRGACAPDNTPSQADKGKCRIKR